MTNCPHRRRQTPTQSPQPLPTAPPPEASAPFFASAEPPVRRWPHPIHSTASQPEAALSAKLADTLERQNQLLSSLCALLETWSGREAEGESRKR